MATSFTEVYDVFLSQFNDQIFLENDTDDELKYRYLRNAIPRFSKCKKDLSDRTIDSFNTDLTDEECLILGTLMVLEYLNPQIATLENLKHSLSSRDFSMTSQANHLLALMNLRNSKKKEVQKLILDYSYNHHKLGDLK